MGGRRRRAGDRTRAKNRRSVYPAHEAAAGAGSAALQGCRTIRDARQRIAIPGIGQSRPSVRRRSRGKRVLRDDLSLRTSPAVIRARSTNHFNNEVIRAPVSNQRRRARCACGRVFVLTPTRDV
jgi:hypothetical protein